MAIWLLWGIDSLEGTERYNGVMHTIFLTYPAFTNLFELEINHKKLKAKIYECKVFAMDNQRLGSKNIQQMAPSSRECLMYVINKDVLGKDMQEI